MEAAPRWLAYLATLLVIGACVFRFGVIRALDRRGDPLPPAAGLRAAGLGLGAALLLALAGVWRLWAQAGSFVEPGEPVTAELLGIVIDTNWGRGWIVQLLAAGLAGAGALFARVTPSGWYSAAAGASAVALAAPLTGHATAAEQAGSWGYPLDALHLLGAGTWLGTLAVVLLAGVAPALREPGEVRGPRVASLINAFHPVALVGAGVTILAGAALSLLYLQGSLSMLWSSGWGRSLSLKLLLLAGVAGLGAWNWRVIRPGLGSAPGASRITRSALLELAVATVLLAVTAVLVARPLPGEE
jgi:putative copper export protein